MSELKRYELMHLAYIDDDEEDRVLFEEAIHAVAENIKVSVFESGYALIDFLQHIHDPRQFPCSIISDMKMPMMNGIDLLRLLKINQQWQAIPVAIFSTSSAPTDSEEAINWGAFGFFTKPITFEELKIVIHGMLNSCQDEMIRQHSLQRII